MNGPAPSFAFWSPTSGSTSFYAILRVYADVLIVTAGGGNVAGTLQPLNSTTIPLAAIFLSDTGTPTRYFAPVPAVVPPGSYVVEYYLQSGSAPALSDTLQATQTFEYAPTGTFIPSSGPITIASISGEVTTMLGSSSLDIELTSGDLLKCITDAIRVLNREHPPTVWITVNTLPNLGQGRVGKYAITIPGAYGVLDLDYAGPENMFGFGSQNPFLVNSLSSYGYAFGTLGWGMVGEIMQDISYRDQYEDIRGRKPDYDQRWVNVSGVPTLFLLTSDMPRHGRHVMVEVIWHYSPNDDPNTGVNAIVPNDLAWVVNYALARAKQILGRILSKYNGLNMPDGSVEGLDGGELKQEGLQSQQALEEEMHTRRRHILPRVG